MQLIGKLGIPVISSWTTSDLIPSLHELSIAKNNFVLERIYHCAYRDKYNDRYTVLLKIPRGGRMFAEDYLFERSFFVVQSEFFELDNYYDSV